MRIGPLCATLAVVGALAGCINLAPRYHRPPRPTPASFPSGPAYAPPSGVVQPVVGWRDFFSDPKLTTVIEEALANNRDLRVAVADIAIARAQYHVQRSALFPTLTGNASVTYGAEPESVLFGGAAPPGVTSGGTFHEHVYTLNAGVSAYELDLFEKIRNLTRAAQQQYFASREARDAAQITLVSEVASDYLAIGYDRALLAIAQETLKSAEGTLDVIRQRFGVGIDSQLDVSLNENIVEQARFTVAQQTTLVAQDRNALDLVVGAPVADDLLLTGVDQPVVTIDRLPSGLDSEVLLTRPDVLQAEDQLRAANANIGAARAAFFPSVELTGQGGLASLALSTLFRGSSFAWTFVPTASQTIFDAGANLGNLQLAKAQRDVDVATYEKAIQSAFREVADALAERGTIEEQLAAQRALVAANTTSLALYTARYERGSDTYLNVLLAQRALFSSRQSLVEVQFAKSTNLVTLYAALGGGLDTPPAAEATEARAAAPSPTKEPQPRP